MKDMFRKNAFQGYIYRKMEDSRLKKSSKNNTISYLKIHVRFLLLLHICPSYFIMEIAFVHLN